MSELYVFFSNDVNPRIDGRAVDRVNEYEDHFYMFDREDEADNVENKRYAHYYARKEDDYGHVFYEYVTTKNAKNA